MKRHIMKFHHPWIRGFERAFCAFFWHFWRIVKRPPANANGPFVIGMDSVHVVFQILAEFITNGTSLAFSRSGFSAE